MGGFGLSKLKLSSHGFLLSLLIMSCIIVLCCAALRCVVSVFGVSLYFRVSQKFLIIVPIVRAVIVARSL